MGGESAGGFLLEYREAFRPAPRVTEGVFDRDFFGFGAVLKKDLHGVRDGASGGIEIILGILRILGDNHAGTQGVDARVSGHWVLVMLRGESAEDKTDRGHVLETVVAVGGIVQRAGFINDSERGLVSGELNALDFAQSVFHERMKLNGAFDGRLGMELGGKGEFEKDVFHHITAQRAGESDGEALKGDVLEAPGLGGERGRVAYFAGHGDQREADGAAGGVASSPGFARASIGGVPIRSERRSIEPGVGDGVGHVFVGATEQGGDYGGGRHPHQ